VTNDYLLLIYNLLYKVLHSRTFPESSKLMPYHHICFHPNQFCFTSTHSFPNYAYKWCSFFE